MPYKVENCSPFPHFAFVKTGPDGSDFHVLAVRATFDWVHDGVLTIAPEQAPVIIADQYESPSVTTGADPPSPARPEDSPLRLESDLLLGKPRADVLVIGHAHAPSGEPAPDWTVGLRVGKLSKSLRVTGPRFWERGAFGSRLTPPRPALRVPLSYRLAYGGTRRRGDDKDVFQENPVGVGYEGRFSFEEPLVPAPQIESPDAPIRALSERHTPEGLGPIARWWMPRRARTGALTREFVRQNPGRMPDDFNWEYYNSAPPSLMYEGFLEGNEHIGTVGLFPEGRSATKLPGYVPLVIASSPLTGLMPLAPKLDTLVIDTDARRVHVTWRLTMPELLSVRSLVFGFSVPGAHAPATAGDALYPLRTRN
jgi:hypothetical protein